MTFRSAAHRVYSRWVRTSDHSRRSIYAAINEAYDAGQAAGLAVDVEAQPVPVPSCRHCAAPAATPAAPGCRCCCHRAVAEGERRRTSSRADRRMNMCLDSQACDDGGEHRWVPVSFRFETQLLDESGRVRIRQPDLHEGRVYVVCMACRTHTYVETEWAGYYLGGPDYSLLDGPEPDATVTGSMSSSEVPGG